MKLRYLVILSGLLILSACGDNNAKNFLDERKYSVEDEYTYSVLLYDYHNSLILSLLGVESDNPDQAAQIEEIRKSVAIRSAMQNSGPLFWPEPWICRRLKKKLLRKYVDGK